MHKELLQLNKKKGNNSVLKIGKKLEWTYYKKYISMANKHMKKFHHHLLSDKGKLQ